MKDLHDYRKSYNKSELIEADIPDEPMSLFKTWFSETENSKSVDEVNAMTVSTIGLDGFPKSRVVLLKDVTASGFVFFTNYHSEKGRAIASNPKVCLSFFWPAMERQVIIKGVAEQTSAQVSDDYFDSRPEGSKLGAIVSNQSEIIASREELEAAMKLLVQQSADKEIQRPKHWGGYLVKPLSIEFWQGRPNRLHDRIIFELNSEHIWEIFRLSP